MIEPISDWPNLKTLFAARYVNFYKGLVESSKLPVSFLARLCEEDQRTVLGRTLSYLKSVCHETSLATLSPAMVKRRMVYMQMQGNDGWRVGLVHELLDAKNEDTRIPGFTIDEIKDMIDFACTN